MELIDSLKSIGFNEKEAKVYLALLSLNNATAYLVAIRSGLKRPTTYVILENLVNKGYCLKMPQKDKHYYMAKSPEECLHLAKEKVSQFEENLPAFLAIQRKNEEKTNVFYYEGIEGVKESLKRTLKNFKNKEAVGFYAHAKDSPEELIKLWDVWNKERIEKNIKVRGITTQDSTTDKYLKNQKEYLIDLKGLPAEKYNSNVSLEIYGKFVQIISSRYLQSVLIENKDIADVLRQIFNLMWEFLEKEKKKKKNRLSFPT